MEDLDHPCCRSDIDLLTDEGMRYGMEEGLELDMVIRGHADQTPFGEFAVFARKAGECSTVDALKQLPAADAEPAHDMIVDAIESLANGGIRLGKRKKV